jgi:hypothetical protein
MNSSPASKEERRVAVSKVILAALISTVIGLGSVGLIVVFAISGEGPFAGNPAAGSDATVLEVSATELLMAYESDRLAADRKFTGRQVIVAGDVEQIGRDIGGNAYLLLNAEDQFYGVQLLFPPSAEAGLASRSKGERVRARCRSAERTAPSSLTTAR